MRFIGVLLILAGLLTGYELVYKGKSIQQIVADLVVFFHVPSGGPGSEAPAPGWSGWPNPVGGEAPAPQANSSTQPLSNRSAGNQAVGF